MISVCIISKTLGDELIPILRSYQNCCDEVLVGFNGDEGQIEKFDSLGFKNLHVIPLEWKGYGDTKNELATHAKNDWILSVDSDEEADEVLQKALLQFQPKNENEIFSIKRKNFLGKELIKYGDWGRGKIFFNRLYHREFTCWNKDDVHEELRIPDNADVTRLMGSLHHYTAKDESEFLEKNKKYAMLSAEKYFKQGRRSTWLKRNISPAFTFIKQYIFQLGFMDGKAGFQIAKGNAKYTMDKYRILQQIVQRK